MNNGTTEATQGRDQYVRVVEKGFYFPTGHRAALVKITQRSMQETPYESAAQKTQIGAYLRMQVHLITREPLKEYQKQTGQFYNWIFKSIRILNNTPIIDAPLDILTLTPSSDLFWPNVNGKPFLFNMIGQPLRGKECYFSAPLLFVNDIYGMDIDKLRKKLKALQKYQDCLKLKDLQHQKIAFTGGLTENTSFETDEITWGWQENPGIKDPCFY